VPEGTSLLKVTVEVPPAKVVGGDTTGCSSVQLMALEGDNATSPAEMAGVGSVAANCTPIGEPSEDGARVIGFTRTNPKPGLWNMHIFGRFRQPRSTYKMTVEYANIALSKSAVEGSVEALNGDLDFQIIDASLEVGPEQTTSTYKIDSLTQTVTSEVHTGQVVDVPDADGNVYRSFGAETMEVTFSTGGSTGNDIDLSVYECETDSADQCYLVNVSGGATDIEEVSFATMPGKFYYATVTGYDMPASSTFFLKEKRVLMASESGSVTIDQARADLYHIGYQFDVAGSTILKHPMVLSGKYAAEGEIVLNNAAGVAVARVPVKVQAGE
jgi:hypothetical protein